MKQNLSEIVSKINILPGLTIFFICGIVFEHLFRAGFFILAALGLFSLISAALFSNHIHKFLASLLLGFFFLGACSLANHNTLNASHISNILANNSAPAQITGRVAGPFSFKKSKTRFILSLRSICVNGIEFKAKGIVLVNADTGIVKGVQYADILSLSGKIYRPFNFSHARNSRFARFDYREYLASQGVYFIFSPNADYPVKILANDRRYLVLKAINKVSDRLNDLLFNNLPQVSATFYSAFLLGRREAIYQDLNDIFIKTGTAHILAISGMNVAIIALILTWFFKAIGIKRRLRLVLCLVGLVFYCVLTGMNPPVLRSTIMAVFFIIGLLLERDGNIYNSLSIAALTMLIFAPGYIFDIGFQLSFLAVLGIVFITPILIERLNFIKDRVLIYTPKNKTFLSLIQGIMFTLCVSLAAWLSVEPLIVYYFKIVTPIALLANILVVPVLTFIQVSGTAFLAIAVIFPALAWPAAYASAAQSAVLINLINLLSRIPGAYFYINLDIKAFWLFIYYVLLISWLIWLKARGRPGVSVPSS